MAVGTVCRGRGRPACLRARPWCAARRADGDFCRPRRGLGGGASRALADVPWTWLRQVHGSAVVVVERPGANRGREADAAVTCCPDAGLVVLTADCAPVGLASPEGVVGVLHAGWRGLMAGVVEATVGTMRALGATRVEAGLGPCIWPHAYRFWDGDLADVVSVFGPAVRSVDGEGYPALDLPAAVAVALERAGAALVANAGICTHCSGDHWSWRARGDQGRQATVVWRPSMPPAAPPETVPGADVNALTPALGALTPALGAPTVATVADRLATVQARIERAGARPGSVTVVAVTKGLGPEAVDAAVGAGLVDIGENYAQEMLSKLGTAPPGARWHFLGQPQRNKLARLAPHVHLWHGLDSEEHALALARRSAVGVRCWSK